MHFFDENFWVAVSFIVFLYFAYKPVKKAILNSLDSKINDIKEKLAQTEKIKAESKLLLEEIQQEMEKFEEYKEKIINKAKVSTERLIEKKTKEMEIALDRKSKSSNQFIEHEKSKISEELRNEFTDTVINTVKNYLAESKNNSISDEEIINKFINKKK
ncbi:MAG: ATP F0F1 synthase subunit B [Rickettsiaceae bacterium]